MKHPHDIIIRPVVSEKAYNTAADRNTYTFVVDSAATKGQIKTAVETIFDEVKVGNVNTLNRKGKKVRNRKTNTTSHRKTIKHAIITLAEGEIEIYGN